MILRISKIIVLAGAAATTFIMLLASQPWNQGNGNLFTLVLFWLWALSPFALLFFIPRHTAPSLLLAWMHFFFTAIIAAFGLLIYFDAFLVHPDAQSGLVFIFIPFYQLMAAVLFVVLFLIFRGSPKT